MPSYVDTGLSVLLITANTRLLRPSDPLPQPSSYSTGPSSRDFRSRNAYDRSSAVAHYLLEILREQADGNLEEEGEHGDAVFKELAEVGSHPNPQQSL